MAMYVRRRRDETLSGCFNGGSHLMASSCISAWPAMGVSADKRAKMNTFVSGTPTADRVSINKSMVLRASGGKMTNASTFFLDLPALTTISILQ